MNRRRILGAMDTLVDKVIGALAPHLCIACGAEGAVLCDRCLLVAGDPIVPRCAGCFRLDDKARTCSNCRHWLRVYAVHITAPYEGIYEQLVRALKFDMQRDAARVIASMMQETLPDVPEDSIVCALPTAPSRVRERGFDHASLIAKHLAAGTGLPRLGLLGRQSNARQLGSSRAQRLNQMKHEFYVKKPDEVKDKTILLVDDVMTTGASLSAAARALKDAGAKRVYGVVFTQGA